MVFVVQMAGPGLVLAPHLYPPSITRNPPETLAANLLRWHNSWGLKMQSKDATSRVGRQLQAWQTSALCDGWHSVLRQMLDAAFTRHVISQKMLSKQNMLVAPLTCLELHFNSTVTATSHWDLRCFACREHPFQRYQWSSGKLVHMIMATTSWRTKTPPTIKTLTRNGLQGLHSTSKHRRPAPTQRCPISCGAGTAILVSFGLLLQQPGLILATP